MTDEQWELEKAKRREFLLKLRDAHIVAFCRYKVDWKVVVALLNDCLAYARVRAKSS